MDINLDLDEADLAALRRRAEREGRSMEEVAKAAINDYVSGRPDRCAPQSSAFEPRTRNCSTD